jgi:hypothetical protein
MAQLPFTRKFNEYPAGGGDGSAGEKCAMWRMLASLFRPETTPMRHQCVAVLAENDAGIPATAKNLDATGA